MTEQATSTETIEVDNNLAREIGRALFLTGLEAPAPEKSEIASRWEAERQDHLRQARKLIRTLERRGNVSLSFEAGETTD